MAGRVDSLACLTCQIWYAMSSSSPGTSTMVTVCPLFTTWMLAASFHSAVLVVTACLTVRAPSYGVLGECQGGSHSFQRSRPLWRRIAQKQWVRPESSPWTGQSFPGSLGLASHSFSGSWILQQGKWLLLAHHRLWGSLPRAQWLKPCALAGDCDGPLRVSRIGPAFGELSSFDFRGPEASCLLGPLVAAAASPTVHLLTLGWMAGGIVSLSVRTLYRFIT